MNDQNNDEESPPLSEEELRRIAEQKRVPLDGASPPPVTPAPGAKGTIYDKYGQIVDDRATRPLPPDEAKEVTPDASVAPPAEKYTNPDENASSSVEKGPDPINQPQPTQPPSLPAEPTRRRFPAFITPTLAVAALLIGVLNLVIFLSDGAGSGAVTPQPIASATSDPAVVALAESATAAAAASPNPTVEPSPTAAPTVPPVTATATSAPTPTITATATATVATATATGEPSPTQTIGDAYANGLVRERDEDWVEMAALMSRVYTEDPDYLDVRDKFSAALYNQSLIELQGLAFQPISIDRVNTLLGRYELILDDILAGEQQDAILSTRRRLAQEWQEILDIYLDGRRALTARQWPAAVEAFERLPIERTENGEEFIILDLPQRLIEAYPGHIAQLVAAGAYAEARAVVERANLLASEYRLSAAPIQTAVAAIPSPTATATAIPATARPTSEPARLRFVKASSNDDPTCITVQVREINTDGWSWRADGELASRVDALFDRSGNSRECGLGFRQQFTFTVFDAAGQPVRGGQGIPVAGGDIMVGTWR